MRVIFVADHLVVSIYLSNLNRLFLILVDLN